MTDLDTLLDANPAPSVRGSLSTQILAATETAKPANDVATRRPWRAIGSVAALAIAAVIFMIQPTSNPDAEWEQLADASGFSELYAWVEN